MQLFRTLPLSRIYLDGDDAREWLGGQITCDVRTPGTSLRYGLLLSAKGRIVTDLWVYEVDGALSLGVHKDRVDAALTRLERYLVMEDVDLRRSDEVLITLQGQGEPNSHSEAPDPEVAASEAAAQVVKSLRSLSTDLTDAMIWESSRLGGAGAEAWTSTEVAAHALEQLETLSEEVSSPPPDHADGVWELWNDARVAAGIPSLSVDVLPFENLLPQEAGLSGAIAFDKGCYVGQEPVIMLEHRGKPRSVLVRCETSAPVGASIVVDGEAGRAAGTVTSRGRAQDAIAVLRFKAMDKPLLAGAAPLSVKSRVAWPSR